MYDLLDLVILIAVLVGIANGYQRGFYLSVLQYAGLVAGVLAGAAAASPIADAIGVHGQVARPLVGVICLIIGGSFGSSIGFYAGQGVHRKLVRNLQAWQVNRALGSIISGVAVLAVVWFLGLSFATGPSALVSQQVQRSAVLRALDGLFPRPPGFLASVQSVLSGLPFPRVFAGLEPNFAPLQLPASLDTAGVRAATAATVKVQGFGCGGIVTGSGFPVARDYIVTNAHVVSGTRGHTVETASGRTLAATVVFFDPKVDVAVLNVPGLGLAPLPTAAGARGTQGAAIGYPGGGQEQADLAVIDAQVQAQGRDIYNQGFVSRQIWILQASPSVIPGNSGGPLVDLHGNVLGIVFAAASNDASQAYALTNDEVHSDIATGTASTTPVATQDYACAV